MRKSNESNAYKKEGIISDDDWKIVPIDWSIQTIEVDWTEVKVDWLSDKSDTIKKNKTEHYKKD